MANEIVETKAIEQVSDSLYKGVSDIIDNARQEVVVYVNKHSDLMFCHIGHNSCDTVAKIDCTLWQGIYLYCCHKDDESCSIL